MIVAPETNVELLRHVKYATKVIWWMSVDNYMKRYNAKVSYQYNGLWAVIKSLIKRRVSFGYPSFDQSITHFYQSEYAKQYLLKKGFKKILPLSDYINDLYFEEYEERHTALSRETDL